MARLALGPRWRPAIEASLRANAGYSLVECLFAVTLIAIIAAASVPPLASALERSRAQAAARFVHARMMLARTRAAARGAVVALRFAGTPEAAVLTTFIDRNRNGIRAADIAAGIDTAEAPAHRACNPSFAAWRLEPVTADGVLFSFTPSARRPPARSTSPAQDGSRFAVRVLGATGRARLLHYVPASGEWKDVE